MARSSATQNRALALVEVLAVFALVHLAFRSFMKFTELGRAEWAAGLNYSPGLAMLLATALLLLLHRRRLAAWGLTLRPWRLNLSAGVLAFVLLAGAGAALMACGFALRPTDLTATSAALVAAVNLAVVAVVLWQLQRRGQGVSRTPAVISGVIALAVLAAPLGLAAWRHESIAAVSLHMGWRLIGAAVGEEVFFRGYVQSRLNEAFGRPWQALGTRFGVGVLIASLLFGLIHALNPVDYFAGSFQFAWWHGLTTALAPFGWLRERTGGIAAAVILHALLDVAALLV